VRAARALALVLLAASTVHAQVRDRAASAPAVAGTAAITGTVMSDTQPSRPVRRVSVMVSCADPVVGRTVITDDAGRFSATNLPAGRYSVSATKPGWVNTSFGAKAPGRPGRSIALADGERATASMRLSRGAVMTGTILDPSGLPPTGLTIRVLRYAYAYNTGERQLTQARANWWGPDDRGMYRVWGLAPGQYYIAAYPAQSFGSTGREVHLTSEADVQDALRATQTPGASSADIDQRAVGVAPVYYPGATSAAQAGAITLRPGEERAGLDFTIQYVTTAHVEGTVSVPGAVGEVPPGTLVNLVGTDASLPGSGFEAIRTVRTTPDGHFDFPDVTPGPYVLAARASIPSGASDVPPRVLSWSSEVEVHGEDMRGVSLMLQEGFTITGVVRAEGNSPPPSFASMRVSLQPVVSGNGVAISASAATTAADGHFTITGITPGRYRFAAYAGTPQSPWSIRSATVDGRDALDTPIELRQGTDTGVVTMTDRPAELRGRIDAAATDYTVLLFSDNRAHWATPSRRILTARVASDGFFQFKNVPPGDYYMVALDDLEPGEWLDPALLQRVTPGAIKVTIAEGEKKVQDLKTGGA